MRPLPGPRPRNGNLIVQPPNLTTQEQPLMDQAEESAPLMAKSGSKTTVFYYRPSDVMRPDGQMVLPLYVYDQSGRAIPTTALVNNAQVYLEPPPQGAAEDFRHGHHHVHEAQIAPGKRQEEPIPLAGAAEANSASNNLAAMATDQSILVGTVGIIALIVGAMSARRLRHQGSWLSVCMENETLEHDAAYDAAFTVDGNNDHNNSHYHTFGWKHDLEKFDV